MDDVSNLADRQASVVRRTSMFALTLALAAAYAISGKLALLLAVLPGFSTPIFPAAGIALAAVTVWGWRALPGLTLGSLITNLIVALETRNGSFSLLMTAPVVLATVLQAWASARVMRKWVNPGMESSQDALRFLLLTPVVCLISASIAVASLYCLGGIYRSSVWLNWFTWWIGDSVGVLLGAPLAWIFIGQPRSLWWRRRWLVGLPLCLASAAFIAIYFKTNQWEQQRESEQFRFKSQQLGDMFQFQFGEHERFLAAVATGINDTAPVFPVEQFREVARTYLENRPEIRSMGWAPRVSEAQRAEFEQWAQRNIDSSFAIRQIGTGKVLDTARKLPQHYPIAYIEPFKGNERALGLDFLSEPIRAATVANAIASGYPAASEPLTLVQERGPKRGILLLQVVKPDLHQVQQEPVAVFSFVLEVST